MIRQAISCDICGAEKKQTNHWFVAWEQAGELRVSGWNSRNRLRTGAKHLCGQVCMHKLADDFMARVIAQKSKAPAAEEMEVGEIPQSAHVDVAPRASTVLVAAASIGAGAHSKAGGLNTDTSLTSHPGSVDLSARMQGSVPEASRPELRAAARMPMRDRPPEDFPVPPLEPLIEPPRFAAHNRRAEAWQRERERTQRAGEPRPEIVARRMGNGD